MPLFGGGVATKKPASVTQQESIVQSVYDANRPTTDLLNITRQNQLRQAGVQGQQYGADSTYSNQLYNTGLQNAGFDLANINAQRQALRGDNRYLTGIHRNQLAGFNADIGLYRQQNQSANKLWNALSGQYGQQGNLLNQQLQSVLQGLGFRTNQANAQYANDAQQLQEQAGAQGAYGSPGQLQRQSFLQSTLGNTLGGLDANRTQAQIQRNQQQSQLREQIAQALNNRNDALAQGKNRIRGAQLGKGKSNLDYAHGLSGTKGRGAQLNAQAGQIGVTRQELANKLQHDLAQAGITFSSGQIGTSQALAQLTKQDYDNLANIISQSNTIGNAIAQGNP